MRRRQELADLCHGAHIAVAALGAGLRTMFGPNPMSGSVFIQVGRVRLRLSQVGSAAPKSSRPTPYIYFFRRTIIGRLRLR